MTGLRVRLCLRLLLLLLLLLLLPRPSPTPPAIAPAAAVVPKADKAASPSPSFSARSKEAVTVAAAGGIGDGQDRLLNAAAAREPERGVVLVPEVAVAVERVWGTVEVEDDLEELLPTTSSRTAAVDADDDAALL